MKNFIIPDFAGAKSARRDDQCKPLGDLHCVCQGILKNLLCLSNANFRITVVLVSAVVVFSQGVLFAASVEIADPQTEKAQALALEFIYSHATGRDIDSDLGDSDKLSQIDEVHMKAAYIVNENFQPYLKVGVAKPTEKLTGVNIAALGKRNLEFTYDYGASYGLGANGVFKLENDVLLGYDAQYLRSSHDMDEITHSSEKGTSKSGRVIMQELHAAFYVGKKFSLGEMDLEVVKAVPVSVTPYLGFRLSGLRLKTAKDIRYTVSEGIITTSFRSKSQDNFGLFGGAVFDISEAWKFRLEGRFLDEAAVTVSGGYRF